jgi:predicted RNA-binding Zn-ribbon protein involved in translation (DUF1610 family)
MSEITRKFHCPACGEEGEITLPKEMMRFNCPAECGAGFLHYHAQAGWAIRCVIKPVFARRA